MGVNRDECTAFVCHKNCLILCAPRRVKIVKSDAARAGRHSSLLDFYCLVALMICGRCHIQTALLFLFSSLPLSLAHWFFRHCMCVHCTMRHSLLLFPVEECLSVWSPIEWAQQNLPPDSTNTCAILRLISYGLPLPSANEHVMKSNKNAISNRTLSTCLLNSDGVYAQNRRAHSPFMGT